MNKEHIIMNILKRIPILVLLIILPFLCWGQGISVRAPKSVLQGDIFDVNFVVDGDAENFKGPAFNGLSLRSGPNLSSMRGFSIANGRQSASIQTTISYVLSADREGTFTIGPASCTANGKKISSESFSIKVEKPTAAQLQQRQQQQQQQQQRQQQQRAAMDPFGFFDIDMDEFFNFDPWGGQQRQPSAPPKIDEGSIFARASVNKTNPWQGEQIIVTYKIYTQLPIRQFSIDKQPGNTGFWSEDLTGANTQVKESTEVVGGRRYTVYEIRRVALFPQRSGTLTIDPLDLSVQLLVRQSNPFYPAQLVEHSLHTPPVHINVKPLPTPPDDFGNAVGKFSIKGGLSLDSVKTGDAVSYKLAISGSGNLSLISTPTPQFPEEFESYEQRIDPKINTSPGGISGSRSFEWALIPRKPGTFTSPAYRFVYFDPSSGKYNTLTVDAQTVTVLSDGTPSEAGVNGSDKGKDDGKGTKDKLRTYLLYGLSALALVFIIVSIIVWVMKKYRSRTVDPVAQRKRNALRIAQRRLKKAASWLSKGEPEPFYQEIYHALWGCLSDKYGIPTSQLNRDTVTSCLVEKQVPEQQQQSILQLLSDVDLARFAPGNPATLMQQVYQKALDVISEI